MKTIFDNLSHNTAKLRSGFALAAASVTALSASGGAAAWAQKPQAARHARTQTATHVRNPAGRDAFYTVQSNSTAQLAAAVKKDARLRRLYAKHFGVPESQIADYVQNALVLYTLPEAQSVTTYGVTKTGRIYPVKQTLKKGSKVWATRSRMPILKWACSNPLTRKLPGTTFASPPRITPAVEAARRVASLPATAVETPEFAPVGALAIPTAITATGGGGGVMAPAIISGGRAGFPIAAFLPVAGLIAITSKGGDNITPPPVTAIPEPGTLALALVAVPFAGALLRKRRFRADR